METRQAAASALGFISRAAGVWDPTRTETSETATLDSANETAANNIAPMSLHEFGVARVLRDGQLLLASSGKEYGKLSQLSAAELEQAHKDVMKNLGLGMGAGMDDIGVDVSAELASDGPAAPASSVPDPSRPALPPPRFKPGNAHGSASGDVKPAEAATKAPPSTVAAASASSSTVSSPAAAAPEPSSPAADTDPYAGLSARERNKLKRKRKAEGKAGVAPSPIPQPAAKKAKVAAAPVPEPSQEPLVSTSPSANGVKQEGVEEETKIVIDPAAKAKERERLGGEIQAKAEAEQAQTEVKAGEWPWRAVVERLSVGLLAPGWETRHGASLGLREILRLQASGGGKLEGVSHAQNAELHRVWVEDLAAKLLYVFALDRFGDYISDQVRERCLSGARPALEYATDSPPPSQYDRWLRPFERQRRKLWLSFCRRCPPRRLSKCGGSSPTWFTSVRTRRHHRPTRASQSTSGRSDTPACSV